MAESYFASIAVSRGCLGVPVQDSGLVQLLGLGVSPSVRQKKMDAMRPLSSGTLRDAFDKLDANDFWEHSLKPVGAIQAQIPKPMRETE